MDPAGEFNPADGNERSHTTSVLSRDTRVCAAKPRKTILIVDRTTKVLERESIFTSPIQQQGETNEIDPYHNDLFIVVERRIYSLHLWIGPVAGSHCMALHGHGSTPSCRQNLFQVGETRSAEDGAVWPFF